MLRWKRIDKVHRQRAPKIIVLDMDSSESPTYGEQEGSAYNGHFGCKTLGLQKLRHLGNTDAQSGAFPLWKAANHQFRLFRSPFASRQRRVAL